jgi:hypothetical protein
LQLFSSRWTLRRDGHCICRHGGGRWTSHFELRRCDVDPRRRCRGFEANTHDELSHFGLAQPGCTLEQRIDVRVVEDVFERHQPHQREPTAEEVAPDLGKAS